MITYFAFAFIVASVAKYYGKSWLGWFFCSLLFTPAIMGFILFLIVVFF